MYPILRCIVLFTLFSSTAISQIAVPPVVPPVVSKKRIAIMNFDYAAVQSDVSAIFGTNQDIGKGIANLTVDRLVADGRYSVIERKVLDKIMAEENFPISDRADPNSAAKLGRLLNVDAIVIGSITQFSRDAGKPEPKTVVSISARLINVDSAEVLAVATCTGQSNRAGTSSLSTGGGNYDMSNREFSNTVIGEAVGQAVADCARKLEANSEKLLTHVLQISGLVADVSGSSLVLNVGSKAGVKVGDRLVVKRTIREVKDPTTDKVLRHMEDKIGEVTITEVDDASAVGRFTGPAPAKVGDTVKNL